jgi:arginine/lysine/ornithine decarboxylase
MLVLHLATNIFILDSSYDNKNIIDTFNLTSDEAKYLDNGKVHGPRQGTSGVMLAKFLTYSGNYSQLISLSYNKLLLCALDNSSELCTLKELLVQHTSYLKALEVISQNFPSGHHVRLEINHMLESNKDNSAIQESDCMDIIARRLIAQIKSQP